MHMPGVRAYAGGACIHRECMHTAGSGVRAYTGVREYAGGRFRQTDA